LLTKLRAHRVGLRVAVGVGVAGSLLVGGRVLESVSAPPRTAHPIERHIPRPATPRPTLPAPKAGDDDVPAVSDDESPSSFTCGVPDPSATLDEVLSCIASGISSPDEDTSPSTDASAAQGCPTERPAVALPAEVP